MTKIKLGDKVIRDTATQNQGKVPLGDARSCVWSGRDSRRR